MLTPSSQPAPDQGPVIGRKRSRQGDLVTLVQWADLLSDMDYVHVDRTTVGSVIVSTVWEGLDEPPGLSGAMYRTGVALAEGGRFTDVAETRTEDDARRVHRAVVQLIEGDPQASLAAIRQRLISVADESRRL